MIALLTLNIPPTAFYLSSMMIFFIMNIMKLFACSISQTQKIAVLLKKYEIGSFVDLNLIYLHNTSIFCLYNNGTANIFETYNVSNFELIATQNFGTENSVIKNVFWRPDGLILYISRNISLDYYENNNLKFTFLLSFTQDKNSFGFSISNDGQLLSYIRQNATFWEYVLIDITNDISSSGMYIQLWSEIPNGHIPYSVKFHPNNENLLLCQTQGMEMVRIVKENSTNETPSLTSKSNLYYSHVFSNWWIEISPTQQTIYMMNSTQQIVSLSVNSFGSDSFQFNNDSSFFIFPYNSSDSDERIMIYKVKNETIFEHQSDIKCKNISDYLVSKEQNFIYVVLYDNVKNATFNSYNISDKKHPVVLATIDLGTMGF